MTQPVFETTATALREKSKLRPPVGIHPAATIERDGYHLQSLVAGEQAGTHWAAPAHFGAGQAAASAPTDCCSVIIASTWRTWPGWARCRRPAAGSSWGASGSAAARARRPPCSA